MHLDEFERQPGQETGRDFWAALSAAILSVLTFALTPDMAIGVAIGISLLVAVVTYACLPPLLRRLGK